MGAATSSGNLLSVALPSGSTVSYLVDGENRRVARELNGTTTSEYLYKNALNVVAQLDGSGNLVTRYVFGSKPNVPDYLVDHSGNKYRVLSDHLGSPRLVVNAATGVVAEEIDYDEFGNITNDTSPGFTVFGFAGGMYDVATGLVRFGARDYDAGVGRWTTKDPIRFTGGLNLYEYVFSDPVDGTDATGLDPIEPPWILLPAYFNCIQKAVSDLQSCYQFDCFVAPTYEQEDCKFYCRSTFIDTVHACGPQRGPPSCSQPGVQCRACR